MNPPSTLYAVLQVIAAFLIVASVFLALFLCMILCLVAAEFTCLGASFVRTKIAKRASLRHPVPSESEGHTRLAPRHIGVTH
jgi:hypothetical protein